MDWKDVGKFVAKSAPLIGGILGGPVGTIAGAAGSMLADYLGVDDNPEVVYKALQANPSALIKVRELEMQKEVDLKRMSEETTRIYLSSQAQVYSEQAKADGHSTRPKIALMMAWMLAIPYFLIGCSIVWAIFKDPIGLKDLWPVMLAYLSIPLGILNKYFGDLRKEHAQNKGQQVDFGLLGGMFGGRKV